MLRRLLPASGSSAPRPTGPHARLRIGLVADELTRSCLRHECTVIDLTPSNFRKVFRRERPDIVFVESAWNGPRSAWKYGVAAYPSHPQRNNASLRALVAEARDLGIPTVFWNKEDGVHFERFIDSASLFETVLTVDASCIGRYRAVVGNVARIEALPFAVQPALHSFSGTVSGRRGANFVGSYSRHIHDERRRRQDLLLSCAARTLGLTVYDRNSDRRGHEYRYPDLPGLVVRAKVPHERTAAIYKQSLASLNVNTVEASPTMFSRRLIEIIACGGLAVSTPALSIDRWFGPYCHTVSNRDEAQDLLGRLARDGYNDDDRARMVDGAAYIAREHTYSRRLDAILDILGRPTGSSAPVA
ncbi:CgeB family protein [Caldimonas sp. KR1-144]|uniref:CgeB family protein n=1 Tax=Caldimonas sp. KR1-144 TaxID=3400911 RepID=UPI003C075CDD